MNFFTPPAFYFSGAGVCAFDRNEMIAGNPNAGGILFTLNSYISLLPADADGSAMPPAGSPQYFVSRGPNELNVFEADIDWGTPSNSTLSGPGYIEVAPYSNSGIVVDQPATTDNLDPLADRLMYRLQYRNFGSHQSMVTNHTVNADGNELLQKYYI